MRSDLKPTRTSILQCVFYTRLFHQEVECVSESIWVIRDDGGVGEGGDVSEREGVTTVMKTFLLLFL